MRLQIALVGAGALLLASPATAQESPSPGGEPAPPETVDAGAAPAPETTPAITVTGQRSTVRTSIDRLSYDVANDLQTQTGSVADALRNVPGVEVDAQGNVSLRGDSNVTILIDGRPSGAFAGEGRADALQQFPADQLARVEVITNPNAALSPEGTAGVINLVTRRDRRPGSFGSLRANVGTEARWNVGVSGSRIGRRLTLSGDAGFRAIGDGENADDRIRATLDPTTGGFVEQRTRGRSNTTAGGFRSARGAIEYDLNARDRLSLEVSHRGFGFDSEGREVFEADAPGGGLASRQERLTTSAFERAGTEARASFRRRYGEESATYAAEDHELIADVVFDRRTVSSDVDTRFIAALPAGDPSVRRANFESESDEVEGKIEYARPMPGEAKLRVGAEGEIELNDYDTFSGEGPSFAELATDVALSNRFQYDEAVYAAFATYERPFGKFTVQAGLRLEQAEIDINQITSGIRGGNEYFRAYPTVFVTYDLDDRQRLRASYSRRIDRPDADDVNPFPVFIDPENLEQGNPNLEPEITDSFEAGYQRRSGAAFYLATLFYRQSSDGITDVVRQLPSGVFLTTKENLAESRSGGLELVANGRITRKLTYNASATALWNEINAPTGGVAAGTRSGTSFGGRASLNWQPTAKDFFQASGFLIGEQLQAQGVREPSGSLNLGYSRKLTDRVTFVFTANNVLDTFKQRVRLDTPELRERTERDFRSPGAFIGLTLALGETQTGGDRRRQDPSFEFDQGGGGPG